MLAVPLQSMSTPPGLAPLQGLTVAAIGTGHGSRGGVDTAVAGEQAGIGGTPRCFDDVFGLFEKGVGAAGGSGSGGHHPGRGAPTTSHPADTGERPGAAAASSSAAAPEGPMASPSVTAVTTVPTDKLSTAELNMILKPVRVV